MERLEAIRKQLQELNDKRSSEYQDVEAQKERRELLLLDYYRDFQPCLDLELFAADVIGYAATIAWKGFVDDPVPALEKLRAYSLFNIPEFADWYFSEAVHYPKTRILASSMEYIRLLTLEHLILQVEKQKG